MSRNPENDRFPISALALNDSMLIKYFIVLCFQCTRDTLLIRKIMTARYRRKCVIQWSQIKKKHAQKICLFIYVFFHLSFINIFFFTVQFFILRLNSLTTRAIRKL